MNFNHILAEFRSNLGLKLNFALFRSILSFICFCCTKPAFSGLDLRRWAFAWSGWPSLPKGPKADPPKADPSKADQPKAITLFQEADRPTLFHIGPTDLLPLKA